MRRSLHVPLVGVVLATFWGYCTVACFLLVPGEFAGKFGLWVGVFLLGAVVLTLFLLYPKSMGHVAHDAVAVLRCIRWRMGTSSCAILALLTCFLWARSFWWIDGLDIPIHGTRYVAILSRVGVLTLGWQIDTQRTGQESTRWDASEVEPYLQQTRMMQELFADANRNTGRKNVFNPDRAFELETRSVSYQGRTLGGVSVSFPHWLLLIAFGIIPAASLATAYRRYRRGARHQCPECEYDLTGNISGVCPECGTAIRTTPADSGSETST